MIPTGAIWEEFRTDRESYKVKTKMFFLILKLYEEIIPTQFSL
jgi:hypothetical protein